MSVVPWSVPSGEKRNLEVDEEMPSKKQCISERESPLLEENDEILWCERLDSEEELNDENEADDDHEVAEMEQLVQRAARKGNERGAKVYEKLLIWAAKDTEWRKLEEKGAVRILSGDSAEKAKSQFGDRFFQVVMLLPVRILESSRLDGVCEVIWTRMSWNWLVVVPPSLQLCLSWDLCCRVK